MATAKKKKSNAGSRRYPKSFKIKALLLLEQNNYNQKKTSEELKVPARTIANWKRDLGGEVFNKNLPKEDELLVPSKRKEAIAKLRGNMLNREEMFLEKVYKARELAIHKGMELTETEKDLKKITDFLRIAHEIITGDHIKSMEERKQTTTYFTNIYQQFVKKEDNETIEIKEHNDKGD